MIRVQVHYNKMSRMVSITCQGLMAQCGGCAVQNAFRWCRWAHMRKHARTHTVTHTHNSSHTYRYTNIHPLLATSGRCHSHALASARCSQVQRRPL